MGTPSLAQFQPQLQHRQEDIKSTKGHNFQCLGSYIFYNSAACILDALKYVIRILYTLFLVCKYFLTPHDTCFFSLYSYLDKTDKRTDLCMINRLKKNNRLITDYVFSLFCFFFLEHIKN